jgi:Pilus formation protein N terminal region
MTALCVPGRMAKSARHWLAAAGLFAVIAACPAGQTLAQSPRSLANAPITVRLDQAALFQLPVSAATVVIGNPLIADVTIQSGVAVVTGKGYGGTNVIVLDHGGVVLLEKQIVVTSPSDHVVYIYRGPSRTTYSCNPDCSARVNLGDDPDVFDKILGETVSRTTQAMTAGANTASSGH